MLRVTPEEIMSGNYQPQSPESDNWRKRLFVTPEEVMQQYPAQQQAEQSQSIIQNFIDRVLGYSKQRTAERAGVDNYDQLNAPTKVAGALATPVYAARDAGKFVGNIGKEMTRDVVSTGLSAAEGVSPSNLKSAFLGKKSKPHDWSVNVFGKDVHSIFYNLDKAGKELKEGKITSEQFAGKTLEQLLTASSIIPMGEGAKAIETGAEMAAKKTLKETLKAGAKDAIKYGGGFGGASGVASGMEENKNLKDVLGSGVAGAAAGTATMGALAGAGHVAGKVFGKMFKKAVKETPKKESLKAKQTPKQKPINEPLNFIKNDKTFSIKEVESIKTPTDKKVAGRYQADFKTKTGKAEIKKGAKPGTIIHEYAHHVNYKLGEFKDKFTNNLVKAINEGKKSFHDYNPKKLYEEMRKVARISGVDPKNVSEEFAHAVKNVIEKPKEAQTTAPTFSDFVAEKVFKNKCSKSDPACVREANKLVSENKGAEKVYGSYGTDIDSVAQNYIRRRRDGMLKKTKHFDHVKVKKDGKYLPDKMDGQVKGAKFFTEREIKQHIVDNYTKDDIIKGKKISWTKKEDQDVEKYIRETKGINKARESAKLKELYAHYKRLSKQWDTVNKTARKGIEKEIRRVQKKIANQKYRKQAKFRTEESVTLKTLDRIKEDIKKPVVSKQALLAYANRGDIKQAERDIIRQVLDEMPDGKVSVEEFSNKVKSELLPLKTISSEKGETIYDPRKSLGSPMYENITLPDKIRGNVANYTENVYTSPIKNSAGDVHFSDGAKNYFSHTRVEDMADKKTRRVIEVQSDLMQKGGLEREFGKPRFDYYYQKDGFSHEDIKNILGEKKAELRSRHWYKDEPNSKRIVDKIDGEYLDIVNDKQKLKQILKKKEEEYLKKSAKLRPYRNTWHERIIREEMKKASEDGIKKLQFPTGETAMKIEGLGREENFMLNDDMGTLLNQNNIKKGETITRMTGGRGTVDDEWVITDVLGNGKFKAVPKSALDKFDGKVNDETVNHPLVHNLIETFDISGELDKSNPIYKFYEKDVQKFLKKIHPEMKRVTNENGVSWFEINPTKKEGFSPVQAFRRAKDNIINGRKFTDRQIKKIEEFNRKLFGDDSVKLTHQIMTPEGQRALGVYSDGMIKILKGQANPKDTYYHEVVHKFLDIMTTMDEHKEALIAAKRYFKVDTFEEAEEALAEAFIKHAKDREGVTGVIKTLFEKLIKRFKTVSENEEAVKDFYNQIFSRKDNPRVDTKPIVQPNTPKKFIKRGEDKTKYTEKLNTTEDVRKMVEKLEKSDKVQRDIQKRGIVSWKETENQAKELGIDYKELKKEAKSAKDFAARVEAIKQLRVNKASELHDFLSQAPRNPTEEQKAEIAKKIDEFLFVDRSLKSISTEHGRAINILKKEVQAEEFDTYNNLIDKILEVDPNRMDELSYIKKVDKIFDNNKEKIENIIGIPRSMMTTSDLSAPLRQGVFTAPKHPILFGKAFKDMFKQAFSEKYYQKQLEKIKNDKNYELMRRFGLALTELDEGLNKREEAIMSNLPERIPVFKHIARGSNRAYTGFLNKLRADYFNHMLKTMKVVEENIPQKRIEDMVKFINAASGRGNLNKFFSKHADILNATFFSPRLIASRLNLLNPVFYYKLDPYVRKEALKSLFAFVSAGAGILSLAKMGGAEVGTDPRSADFGKIKLGNTRVDIWGGFQQYAVLASRLITGEMVSSTTGREFALGEGYKPTTRGDIIQRFFSYKTSPVTSFALGLLNGKNAIGQDFDLPVEVTKRFIPMIYSDIYDLMKNKQSPILSVPAVFGTGLQTYGDKIPFRVKTATGRTKIKWEDKPGLAEDLVDVFRGRRLSNVPKNQWKTLYEKKLKKDKERAELSNIKRRVLKTGKPARYKGKYIYLENGIVKTR